METRSRFLLALPGLVALCAYRIHLGLGEITPYVKHSYYNWIFYTAQETLAATWIVAVLLLSVGGPVREKAVQSSWLTLSLPVTRKQLMWVRTGVIAAEGFALSLVPVLVMMLVQSGIAMPALLLQAGFGFLFLLGGGAVFFSAALLISSIVEGEYLALAITFVAFIGMSVGLGRKTLRPFSPFEFMVGSEYIDRINYVFGSPFPWSMLVLWIAVSIGLLAVAVHLVERRDF